MKKALTPLFLICVIGAVFAQNTGSLGETTFDFFSLLVVAGGVVTICIGYLLFEYAKTRIWTI